MRLERSGRSRQVLAAAATLWVAGCVAAFAQRRQVTPRMPGEGRVPATSTDLGGRFRFTQAPEGLVQVSAWQPTRLPLATAGGEPPITYSVTAERQPDLFQVLQTPTIEGAPAIGRRTESSPSTAGLHGQSPALLFKGLNPGGYFGAGNDLPVTITATDGRGQTATRTFTVEALPGRISKMELTDADVVRAQNTRVQVTVDFLPPDSSVVVTDTVTYLSGAPRGLPRLDCSFVPRETFGSGNGPRAAADSNGQATFDFTGVFSASDAGKTGPCGIGLTMEITPRGSTDKKKVWALANRGFVRIGSPTTYRVDRTWTLNSRFKVAVSPPLPGSCIGLSVFTGGSFPVGAFEDENGDLALAVRSGPLGTDCKVQSSAWALPDGFRLVGIDWDVQRTGENCCIGDACRPSSAAASPGIIVPGAIPSENAQHYENASNGDPLKDQTGVSAGSNPSHQIRRVFGMMEARLACKETPSNDHGVRATLKSITFEGPPGQTFP